VCIFFLSQVSAVPAALETRRKCEEKLRLLRQVSPPRAATVDLSGLLSQWDDFTARLSQHEAHLTEQKEKLRVKIDSDMSEFCGRLEGFAARWEEVKPKGAAMTSAETVMQKIEDAFRSVQELEAEAEQFVSACGAFAMETPKGFRILEGLKADVQTTQEAWGRYGSFSTERNELTGKLWTTVRGKLHVVEEFLLKWAEAVKGSVKNDPVSVLILQETERYRKCLPFLRFVREDIKWAEVSALLGMTENGRAEVKFDDLTLGHFLARADAMVSKGEELKALHAQAQGEVIIRDSLHVLKVWGLERRFTLIKYESGKPCALIKEWKDIMTEVGDHQSLVQSLKESPFFPPFKDDTSTWERRLGVLTEGLQQLNGIQRKWVYLEPIFAGGALPQEQVRFRRVDEEFRQLMNGIEADTLVVSFAEVPRLRETLPRLGAQLDICQKALSDFLEEKRSHFPRFYFIGDDDMLEILGQAKNPTVIQAHLKKLFAGMHSVNFSVNNQSIVAMKSVDGEVVTLLNPVVIRDRVEDWLSDLAVGMKATLKEMLAQCLQTKDYAKFPMQV
jgi:dynein heavy chain 2